MNYLNKVKENNMTKIICMGDIFYTSLEHNKRHLCSYFKIFYPIIKDAISKNVNITFDIVDDEGKMFSREYFFELAGIKTVKYTCQHYNTENFTKEQIDYLKRFFNKDTVILGFEMYQPLCDLLTSIGCKVFDFAFHSYKLFDDNTFAIYTNNLEVYEQLQKYKIPNEKFVYYANYWKVFLQLNNMVQDNDIEENSALFIGQTLEDKSVKKDEKYFNVTDFGAELDEIAKNYSKIYYLPHPYLGKKRKLIYDWIKTKPYMQVLDNRSTYGLLASPKIKKVIGISTSVLYEAQYFDKDAEYLYQPLFNIDAPFEEHSYVSIDNDYWNPKFWADILSPICEVNKNVKDCNYFSGCSNKLRNIRDTYWGYAQLDPIKRIPTFQESVKNLYRQYIAPLF